MLAHLGLTREQAYPPDEAVEAFWWLNRHGLTPAQVDELPAIVGAWTPGLTAEWDRRVPRF